MELRALDTRGYWHKLGQPSQSWVLICMALKLLPFSERAEDLFILTSDWSGRLSEEQEQALRELTEHVPELAP